MHASDLDHLMEEIGPHTAGVTAVVKDGDAGWALMMECHQVINLALRKNPDRLELVVKLRPLQDHCAHSVLQAMMMFNFLSADTGGARMGLCAPSHCIYLMRDLPVGGLGLASLQAAVRELANEAATWSGFMDRAAESRPVNSPSSHFLERA